MRIDAASMNAPFVKRNSDQALQPAKLSRVNAQAATNALQPLALASTAGTSPASVPVSPAVLESQSNLQNPRISAAINDLLKHWGTSDATHDLNADGTVDSIDLGYLLSQFGSAPTAGGSNQTSAAAPAPTPLPDPTPAPADEILTEPTPIPDVPSPLAALLNQWGETSSQFDLNHDGTVNTLDLGILLSTMGSNDPGPGTAPTPGAQAAAPATNASTSAISPMLEETITQAALKVSDAVFAALDLDQDGQIPLSDLPATTPQSLIKALDPAGDGVLTQRGLMQAIHSSLTQAATNNASFDLSAFADKWIAALTSPPAESQPDPALKAADDNSTKLTRLADLLAQRLARTDVTAASATALRKSIDDSTMGTDLKSQLLNLIGSRFPRGLNVNAVA